MNNALTQYHDFVEKYPNRTSEEIKKYVKIQKKMLKIFDFDEEKAAHAVNWIEKNCVLVQGENAGSNFKLDLYQKWILYSVYGFYGNFKEPIYDDEKNIIGEVDVYTRVVNDVLLLIATGNAKTSLLGFNNAYILYSNKFSIPNIYIGSNATKQSRLCYQTTCDIIKKNKQLAKHARIRDSFGDAIISRPNDEAYILAMSSDGKNYEGIIPTIIIIDETHEMKTGAYATNLRKSVKRADSLIFEATTEGTVTGGYLDDRKEYSEKVLNEEVINYRFAPFIFKQDSIDEILEAYKSGDTEIFMKSNPGLGVAISYTKLMEKLKSMIDDPSQTTAVLTKNFNIPQNPETSFFSERECKAKPFDEAIFNNALVFLGGDMALTRTRDSDLTCLSFMVFDPFRNESYHKDIYLIPKYEVYEKNIGGQKVIEKLDMAKNKSKVDTMILYDEKNELYGYHEYAKRGEVVIIDEDLISEWTSKYGDWVRSEPTGITQEMVWCVICDFVNKHNCRIVKSSIDPKYASQLISKLNIEIASYDDMDVCMEFKMEYANHSQPAIAECKELRGRGAVYCNSKLTELHFANAIAKYDKNDKVSFINPKKSRKDGLISHLACYNARLAFLSNRKTGEENTVAYKEYWASVMEEKVLQFKSMEKN